MQPNTLRPTQNALGRAHWDDTQVNYWTRGDGRALSFSNTNCKIIASSARSNDDQARQGECDIDRTARQLINNQIEMAGQPTAGRAGRGGGGRGGRGGRFPKWNEASAPCKTGEVRACKDLEGNVFTIGSGNKGKDGDLLWISKEKLALYIGTNYGDDACQEWLSEKQLVKKSSIGGKQYLDYL